MKNHRSPLLSTFYRQFDAHYLDNHFHSNENESEPDLLIQLFHHYQTEQY